LKIIATASYPMPTTLRTYNIFCWNSSPIKKLTELYWCGHTNGWRLKPLIKKTKEKRFIKLKKLKKYKKMSLANVQGKLNRNEMKNVMAGYSGSGPCKSSCEKWNTSTSKYDSGSCSQGTVTIGNTTATTCDCSLPGGSSCYKES
jgi:hypothetical protein